LLVAYAAGAFVSLGVPVPPDAWQHPGTPTDHSRPLSQSRMSVGGPQVARDVA